MDECLVRSEIIDAGIIIAFLPFRVNELFLLH